MLQFLDRLLRREANVPEITRQLVLLLNITASRKSLRRELQGHPDYPSLLSISDFLHNHGIENISAIFSPEKLPDLPFPVVVLLRNKKGTGSFFSVIKEVNDGLVYFFDPEKHKWNISRTGDFIRRCSDVALLAIEK